MKIKSSVLSCMVISALAINIAHADLIIGDSVNSKPQPQPQRIQLNSQKLDIKLVEGSNKTITAQKFGYVKNIGTPINSVLVKGMGNNLPLSTVLQQIIPSGWQVDKSEDLNINQQVSWKGGEQWYKIIGKVAEDANLLVDINWDLKKVIISNNKNNPQPIVLKSTTKSTTVATPDTKKVVINNPTVKVDTTTQVLKQPQYQNYGNTSPTPSQTWELKREKTLRENLDDWAKKIGWVLSWDAPDYKIVNNVTLYGALDDPNGPIARVVNSYKDAKQPLRAKINRGNKVIRIESRNYEQESVVQKTAQELYNTSLSK